MVREARNISSGDRHNTKRSFRRKHGRSGERLLNPSQQRRRFLRKTLIQQPPPRIWLRGAPTIGVMRLALLFRPIIIVATGSGIGPCLSFLNLNREHPMRVLWSTRSPETTYGYGIIRDVLEADPRAVIVDTTKMRCRVHVKALAFALVREIGAEGVMVIRIRRARNMWCMGWRVGE